MVLSKNFNSDEFDSRDTKGTGMLMDKQFIEQLQKAREIAGIPFVINSGYRTREYNKFIGGVPNSAHTKGKAADIAIKNDRERYIVLNALILAGFKRIGIYKTFIHCDNDDSLPMRVIWYK